MLMSHQEPFNSFPASEKSSNALQDLHDHDLVVNCSGLGATELVGDRTMYPIKGHVIRVHAPWIKHIYFMDENTYVIPNKDNVVSTALTLAVPALLLPCLTSAVSVMDPFWRGSLP